MSESLVSLSPPKCLEFQLVREQQSKTVLKVTNTSSSKIAFKVKTTQPLWYFVRPNQQMLDVGETENVDILLVVTECNRFLDEYEKGKAVTLEKHRFLVQTTPIENERYSQILKLPPPQRGEELSKIWDRDDKSVKHNIRLKVDFQVSSAPGIHHTKTSSTGSIQLHHDAKQGSSSSANTSNEAIFAELQSLRKKFDAVVEYTVHLTAERDSIMMELETAKKELQTVKKDMQDANDDSTGIKGKKEKLDGKIIDEQGFSLLVVLLATLLAFCVGKYTG